MILDSRDTMDAFRGLKAAVESGQIPRARLEASVRRDPHGEGAPGSAPFAHGQPRRSSRRSVGSRRHAAFAQQVSDRAVTLIKDERGSVPLKLAPTESVLYLSVLDYPGAVAHRGAESHADAGAARAVARHRGRRSVRRDDAERAGAGQKRWRDASTRSSPASSCARPPAAAASISAAPVARLLQDLARASARRGQPMVTVFFGNPYVPLSVPELPAMLETYDFSDYAELSAVRAMAGEIPIGGKLPIAFPGLFPLGHGLTRPRRRRRPSGSRGDAASDAVRRGRRSRWRPVSPDPVTVPLMLGSTFRASN